MYTNTASLVFNENHAQQNAFLDKDNKPGTLSSQFPGQGSMFTRGTICSAVDQSLKKCVKTCVTQIIMAKAAGGPRAPQQRGHWDKDSWEDEPENFETHH